MEEIERQREITMVSRGVSRFYKHQEKLAEQDRQWDAAPSSGLINEMTAALVPGIKEVQVVARKKFLDSLAGKGTRLQGWETDVATLDPVMLAYITVRTLITRSGATKHVLINHIGTTISLEIQFERMRAEEGRLTKLEGRRNRIEDLKRQVKEVGPRTVRKWMKKLDDLDTCEWSYDTKIVVGLLMFEAAQLRLADYLDTEVVSLSTQGQPGRKRLFARLNEATQNRLNLRVEELAHASPWLVPMVCPPRDWVEEIADDKDLRDPSAEFSYHGGYLSIPRSLIKNDNFLGLGNGAAHGMYVPPEVTEAVNLIQKTPWRINAAVLDVARRAYNANMGDILPVEPPRDLPEAIGEDEWDAMSHEDRGKHKNDRRVIHDHNNRLEAKRESVRRCLAVAIDHVEFERIYFPHDLDWRGRIYPIPQDLNPQIDDFGRGLLELGEGKALGSSGLKWLCHVVAATYGQDKLSLDDQVQWVMEDLDMLHHVATDPLGQGYEWMSRAEDPWQFLAAAMELEEALSSGGPLEDYISHLPCHVDGTCNGLQHLSALGKDPVGAEATNLMPGDRQDIYQIVADKVATQVSVDAGTADHPQQEHAGAWFGNITRKTVKRGVMTTPYGVTSEGIRAQLIKDRLCDDLEGDKLKNASYMRDQMIGAIDDTIVMGRAIMVWMQNVATELAAQGKPVHWTSPTGLQCSQEYRNPKEKRVQTLLGRTKYYASSATGTIRRAKQRNSVAPNIVHSYDAAHLMKTVNSCSRDGITAFAVVHDSFGTHACDVDTLGRHLRDQFIDIYGGIDWLEVMANSFSHQLGYCWIDGQDKDPDSEWIIPPERGDYDIEEVRRSRYFFF